MAYHYSNFPSTVASEGRDCPKGDLGFQVLKITVCCTRKRYYRIKTEYHVGIISHVNKGIDEDNRNNKYITNFFFLFTLRKRWNCKKMLLT